MKTSACFLGFFLISAVGVSIAQNPSATSASSPTNRMPIAQTPAPTNREQSASGKPPYVEGSVWMLTFIKTRSGLTDDYLRSIAGSLKPFYEEEKKQRLILDYKILTGDAADRDFNVILMVEYPNMAALDSARERAEPIVDKIIGPTEKRREVAMKRSDTRDILGSKTMREIRLK